MSQQDTCTKNEERKHHVRNQHVLYTADESLNATSKIGDVLYVA